MPVPSYKFFNVDAFEKCEPPPVVKLAGRPKVKRIRSSTEQKRGQQSGTLGRKGVRMTCSICHVEGHNKAKCPQIKKDKVSKDNTTEKSMDGGQTAEKKREKGKEKVSSLEKGKKKASSSEKGKKKVMSSEKGKEAVKRKPTDDLQEKCIRRSRRVVGMGVYIDDTSGNVTLNPGMSSETLITQRDPIASQQLSSNPDPQISYPVPNERLIRQEQRSSILSKSSASRKIAFAATGEQSIMPTNLPFKPPGPTWKGQPCTTRSQLEKQRDKKKYKKQ
ncbi:hypothetical protein C2S52_007208 [Perilla frutescens var. hirtella]|nr:hypothetical protein C2S52_007208 [Perilla frutescens var. hirtella]KAH6796311.1 hypothetical protein C2S51_037297 [Perilla frutescens var. frutescens]